MELPSSLAAHDGAVSDKNTRGQWGDALFGMVARLAGWSLLAVMAGIILVLVWGGRQAFLAFGPAFLTSTAWNPISQSFWRGNLHFRHAGHHGGRACLCRAVCLWRRLLARGNGAPRPGAVH